MFDLISTQNFRIYIIIRLSISQRMGHFTEIICFPLPTDSWTGGTNTLLSLILYWFFTQFLLMTQIIMTLTMLKIVKKDYNLYQVVLSIFQTIQPFIYSFHKNTSSVYSIPKVVLGPRNNPFNEVDFIPTCLRVYREEVKDAK